MLSSFECFSFFYSRAERLSFHTTPFDFFTKRTEELRRKNVFSASSSIVVGFVVLDFLLKRLHEYDDDDARNDSSSSNDDDIDGREAQRTRATSPQGGMGLDQPIST